MNLHRTSPEQTGVAVILIEDRCERVYLFSDNIILEALKLAKELDGEVQVVMSFFNYTELNRALVQLEIEKEMNEHLSLYYMNEIRSGVLNINNYEKFYKTSLYL